MLTDESKIRSKKLQKKYAKALDKEFGDLHINIEVLGVENNIVNLQMGIADQKDHIILVIGNDYKLRAGDVVELVLDNRPLHFSDLTTLSFI